MKILIFALLCFALAQDTPTSKPQQNIAKHSQSSTKTIPKTETGNKPQATNIQATPPQKRQQIEPKTPTSPQEQPKNPQIQQIQPSLPFQNAANAAKELITDLRKPTKLTLNDILPSKASSKIIEYSLLGSLVLFAVLQILSLSFGKKKKRYTQKFEQYSQRTEIAELQESAD